MVITGLRGACHRQVLPADGKVMPEFFLAIISSRGGRAGKLPVTSFPLFLMYVCLIDKLLVDI